jgi:hypothetical protein
MRSFIVFDTTTNTPKEFTNLAVTTWGELKQHLPNYDSSRMKAMVKENKTDLSDDGALLPTGIGKNSKNESNGKDFTLFLLPTKVKSGNEITEKNINKIKLELINNASLLINEKFDELLVLEKSKFEISNSEVESLKQEAAQITNNQN